MLTYTKEMNISNVLYFDFLIKGKQRRLKQAKEEAQEEIEKYRLERDRQFKEFEAKVIKKCFNMLDFKI